MKARSSSSSHQHEPVTGSAMSTRVDEDIDYDALSGMMDELTGKGEPDPARCAALWEQLGSRGQELVMTDGTMGPKARALGLGMDSGGGGYLSAALGFFGGALGQAAATVQDKAGTLGDAVQQRTEGLYSAGASLRNEAAELGSRLPRWAMSLFGAAEGEQVAEACAMSPLEEAAPSPTYALPEGPLDLEYANQRDNAYRNDRGVFGDNMCTVTSLSMQLQGIYGSAVAVNLATAALIRRYGGTPPPEAELSGRQCEDVIMLLFDALTAAGVWEQHKDSRSAPFYGGWRNDVPAGWKYHQSGVCQAYALSLYDEITYTTNLSPLADGYSDRFEDWFKEKVKPELDAGVTFSLSTSLTNGHFVTLLDVLGDGVLIHDPYGTRANKGYIRNGSPDYEARILEEQETLAVRFSHNPELASYLDASPPEPVNNWGERNFFTWEEVLKWRIGRMATAATAGMSPV